MPRRKQARRTTVKDIRTILRLTHEEGLSVREIAERLKIGKSSVSTYLLRAREAGLSWPLPLGPDEDAKLERRLFGRAGRPPRDVGEPDWAQVVRELKRKGGKHPSSHAVSALADENQSVRVLRFSSKRGA